MPNPSSGIIVEKCGQLGFAKADRVEREKLASDLAQLVDVPLPLVVVDAVEGHYRFAISHIHSARSRALIRKNEFLRPYSPAENAALRNASGLLPFLAWVGAEDHQDDTNLVLDEMPDGTLRAVAVDFEHAFSWSNSQDDVQLPKPPGLIANVDRDLVRRSLEAIEALDLEQIHTCCVCAYGDQPMADMTAQALMLRQSRIRAPLEREGWL